MRIRADPDLQHCLKYVNYLGKCVNVLSQDFWDVWLSMDMGSDIMEGYIKWIRQINKIIKSIADTQIFKYSVLLLVKKILVIVHLKVPF
jgi:hypothetical protein